jgi:hypothetical protein
MNYTYQHDPRISGADFEDDDDYDQEGDDCSKCGAILGSFGRCFYCDRAWVWVDGDDPREPANDELPF